MNYTKIKDKRTPTCAGNHAFPKQASMSLICLAGDDLDGEAVTTEGGAMLSQIPARYQTGTRQGRLEPNVSIT